MLPLALSLTVSLAVSLGLLMLYRDWIHQSQLQLELDRCVGQEARAMARRLNKIETINVEMRRLRILAAVTTLLPEARLSLQRLIELEVVRQEAHRVAWLTRWTVWNLQQVCQVSHRTRIFYLPYPVFPMKRPPPDWIGQKPLEWSFPDRVLKLTARSRSRQGRAYVGLKGLGRYEAQWKRTGLD